MAAHWRDPDLGVVHQIRSHGQRTYDVKPGILYELSVDEVFSAFSRIATMRCGRRIEVNRDEYILPDGAARLQVPPPILRPWLTTRESPTCLGCVAEPEPEDAEFQNAWGSKLRGA